MDDSDKIKLYAGKVDQLETANAELEDENLKLKQTNADLLAKLVEKGTITQAESDTIEKV